MNTSTPEIMQALDAILREHGELCEDTAPAILVKLCKKLGRERDEARGQLARICKEGFGNDDTIGLEPADDYVLRKLADLRIKHSADVAELNQRLIDRHADMMATIVHLRQALSGRIVSCSQCNESARTIAEMWEAIKEAYSSIKNASTIIGTTPKQDQVLAKLQPFLK